MSSPNSNPQDNPQEPSTRETSLLPWPEYTELTSGVLPDDWERLPHPKELQYLPDGEHTPYELKQIVKRSLYKRESESSNSRDVTAEVQDSETQSANAPKPLPDTPEKQRSGSLGSANSSKTCSGGSEVASAVPGDAASPIPGPIDAGHKARELKQKSSFLFSKIERLGAKIEKLDIVSSRKSPRTIEQQKPIETAECTSCFDDLPKSDMTSLGCTHKYCKLCFTTLILTAMQNESLFPPKCCLTEIPLKIVLSALDDDQRSRYKQKAAEWTQPSEKRWYCPEPNCSKWIPPSKIHRSWATELMCPHCRTSICRTCRGLAHAQDTHCPQDFGLNAMLDIAEREGWRRCYQCKALVEKTSGCRHMTCTCRAQFCYTCGRRWRTCGCTEVDQARREEELRERRRAADAEARREEEEITRAIAEVEAAERREAEEREAAERRREEERQREEEELRRLEELRLAEEEQRRRDEEEAEQKRIEAIKSSIEERTSSLAKMLTELVQIQQTALTSRHDKAFQAIQTDLETRLASRQNDYEWQKQKLLANIEKRSRLMKQKHDAETCATTSRHEGEEDDVFMQVQMHLRGKPNREAREKTMLETLTQSHRDELARLVDRQTAEAARLRDSAAMEAKGLEHGHCAQVGKIKNTTQQEMVHLNREMMAERHWFEAVTRRRHALLQDLRNDLLRTMGESTLLEEWDALPFPLTEQSLNTLSSGQNLFNHSIQTPNSPLTPPSSPDTAEASPVLSVAKDQLSSVVPTANPPKPTVFMAAVVTESHIANEESSQPIWEAQSHLPRQSGATSTTSRLILTLGRRNGFKADKFSTKWSPLYGRGKKQQVEEEGLKGMPVDVKA